MQGHEGVEIPVEAGDLLGRFEQIERVHVPFKLIPLQPPVAAEQTGQVVRVQQ